MQAQQVAPLSVAAEHDVDMEQADQGHKKSPLRKVKDKAKKLKTKIKKPKSPGATGDNNDESSSGTSGDEEECENEPNQQQLAEQTDVVVKPGPKGDTLDAVVDPHVESEGGLNERFEQLRVADDPSATKLQEEVPSAPDNTDAGGQEKPLQNPIAEGATAPKDSITATGESVSGENKPSITGRAAATVLGLKDTIASKLGYGSSKNLTRGTDAPMDTSPTTQVDAPMDTSPTTQVDAQNPENKSVLQKIQENAAGATTVVTSKLGYGEKESPSSEARSEEMSSRDNKSYTQKAKEMAYGAKDTVAAKLGYGGTTTKDDVASATEGGNKSYLQKAQETAVGAKDAVASKLGYGNRDIPAAETEGAYGEEQNVPASTAARFHPGEEDRALSQLITEKMSTGAATVKGTLFKPFGSKSGPTTPVTTPPPSSAAAVEAEPVHSTARHDAVQEEKAEKPGIVGKVTGAVSSLLGTSPSGEKNVDDALGKASEDPQAEATTGVSNVETS